MIDFLINHLLSFITLTFSYLFLVPEKEILLIVDTGRINIVLEHECLYKYMLSENTESVNSEVDLSRQGV